MPVLCIHSGAQSLSFLFVDSPKPPIFSTFAYPYCDNLFSPSFSFDDYIKGVTKEALNIDILRCDVLLTASGNLPKTSLNVKLAETLPKALLGAATINAVYADDFTLASFGSDVSLGTKPNLSLYPFVTQAAEFEGFPRIESQSFHKSKPVVFCGKQFEGKNEPIAYLRMFEFMKGAGVFEVYLDSNGRLPVLGLLGLYDPGAYVDALDLVGLDKVGLVISTDGPVECLVETPSGTQQLIEVESNDLFVLPLAPKLESRLVVKSRRLGCVEKLVAGGSLGVAVDTREKSANREKWKTVISAGLRGL